MYPYLLSKFTNRYLTPEYIGQHKVFLALFNDFYLKGDTSYISAESRRAIFTWAYKFMANQPGDQAPALDLTDTAGNRVSLYNTYAPFTIVVFWDPLCSHCRDMLPRIDNIYKAKWNKLGLKVFAVNINSSSVNDMKEFIGTEHLSSDWLHTYEDKNAEQVQGNTQPGFRQLYDLYETPTLYLLDENKRILAKKMTLEQFDDLIAVKLKEK